MDFIQSPQTVNVIPLFLNSQCNFVCYLSSQETFRYLLDKEFYMKLLALNV